MKKLYSFCWDCGRMGSLRGLFVAEESDVDAAIGTHIYLGDVLGKHSNVHGVLTAEDFEVRSDDQEFIAKLVEVMDTNSISGYNPLSYLE